MPFVTLGASSNKMSEEAQNFITCQARKNAESWRKSRPTMSVETCQPFDPTAQSHHKKA
jgi:hypothetical protein